jgi:hypothetical protein
MKFKTIPNPNAGKYRIMTQGKRSVVLDGRFFNTSEEALVVGRSKKVCFKIIKLPDTKIVYDFN